MASKTIIPVKTVDEVKTWMEGKGWLVVGEYHEREVQEYDTKNGKVTRVENNRMLCLSPSGCIVEARFDRNRNVKVLIGATSGDY